MYKIAICDPIISYLDLVESNIRSLYQSNKSIKVFLFCSIAELLDFRFQLYDLVFLTLDSTDMIGIETANQLRVQNPNVLIIFISSNQPPTPETFKAQPFRYLIKDKENTMLKLELPSILKEMEARFSRPMLPVTKDGLLMRIPISSILYISIAKHGAVIHRYSTNEDSYFTCRESVRELYSTLSNYDFVYVHNSYIVNMSHIIVVKKNYLQLSNSMELNISRSKMKQFSETFSMYLKKFYKRKYFPM